MKIQINSSFAKDAKGLPNHIISQFLRLSNDIQESESLSTLQNTRDIKKMSGYEGFFRIRIGNYRIGFYHKGADIQFIRALHRKDIYKYFPK